MSDKLKARNMFMTDTLLSLKCAHYECEDCWYTCPEHPEYCGEDVGCNCGANKTNKLIDEALQELIKFIEEDNV